MKVRTRSASETRDVGGIVARALRAGDLVVLSGELGAGKTTFAQGVATALGVDEPVVSPTFTLVREYATTEPPLVHVDVYRLDHVQELHDLGFDELVDGRRVTLVEWGETVVQALPVEHLVVRLEQGATPDERWISLTAQSTAWRSRLDALEHALGSRSDRDDG